MKIGFLQVWVCLVTERKTSMKRVFGGGFRGLKKGVITKGVFSLEESLDSL